MSGDGLGGVVPCSHNVLKVTLSPSIFPSTHSPSSIYVGGATSVHVRVVLFVMMVYFVTQEYYKKLHQVCVYSA